MFYFLRNMYGMGRVTIDDLERYTDNDIISAEEAQRIIDEFAPINEQPMQDNSSGFPSI